MHGYREGYARHPEPGWLETDPLRNQYARAKDAQADYMAEELFHPCRKTRAVAAATRPASAPGCTS